MKPQKNNGIFSNKIKKKINIFLMNIIFLWIREALHICHLHQRILCMNAKKKTPLFYKLKKNHFCETVKNTEFKGYILTNASPTPLRSEKI